jgi:GNAT superfamily N-acetyltransferase
VPGLGVADVGDTLLAQPPEGVQEPGRPPSCCGRPPADSEFCYQLNKAAMGDYVTAIWGWDEQVQRGFHDRAFDSGRWQIITAGGTDIGVLDVEHRPGEIYLARIEVHPSYQGHGIGTGLISALIDEATHNGQDLVLDVLTINGTPEEIAHAVSLVGPALAGFDGTLYDAWTPDIEGSPIDYSVRS